jgi:hypothetical protein
MKYTDVLVNGQFEAVQQMVQQLFWQHGFTVDWQDGYTGKAHKGSKGGNFIGGALAQYYEVDFQLFSDPSRGTGVRLFKSNTGLMGGVAGVAMVKKQYKEVVNNMSTYFQTNGMFLGTQEGKTK